MQFPPLHATVAKHVLMLMAIVAPGAATLSHVQSIASANISLGDLVRPIAAMACSTVILAHLLVLNTMADLVRALLCVIVASLLDVRLIVRADSPLGARVAQHAALARNIEHTASLLQRRTEAKRAAIVTVIVNQDLVN
eukprot:TRINITY_DN10527_c0_g1_i3.p3 TRINITY_DN10527_c0_g1~~TRINITY_DN10527_c0_g1_i3.p3  ORF type:complete len:139 (+),score=5.27 TRINITY_DN10527_c0_g1_i3:902-1318(+)